MTSLHRYLFFFTSLKWVVIIGLFTFSSSFCQNFPSRPNRVDQQNLRQGEWIILYDDRWQEINEPSQASYYRLISYSNNLPAGKVRDHYGNGIVQWEGTLISDRPDKYEGIQSWYYESGQKRIDEPYKNGEVSGQALIFLRDGTGANSEWKSSFYDKAGAAYDKGEYSIAAELFEISLKHVEATLTKESEEYADILLWLTFVQHRLGRREEMLRYYLQLTSVYKVIRKADDDDYLTSLFDVGRSYKFLNEWARAEEWYNEYQLREKVIDGRHHSMHGLAMSGLAEIYMETQRYTLALAILEKAKRFYEKFPPEEPMESELVNTNLRRANMLAGQWTDGKKLLLEELKEIEKHQSKNTQAYAAGLSALGNFYRMNGQLREAQTCFLNSLEIIKKLSTEESPINVLSSCIPLIEVYYQLGQPQFGEKYIRLGKEALSAYDINTPGYDLMYVNFQKRAFTYYSIMGNVAMTEQTLSEWSHFAKEFFGPTSMEYLYALMSMGEHANQRSQLPKAEQIYREAGEIILGYHPLEMSSSDIRLVSKVLQQTATFHLLLAMNGKSGSINTSEVNYLKSKAMLLRLPEQGFIPEMIDVLLGLAMVNEMKGNPVMADKLYFECLELVKKYFGTDHINYAVMLFAVAKKAELRNDIKISYQYYSQGLDKLQSYITSVFPYLSINEKESFYQANAAWINNFQSFAVNHDAELPGLSGRLYDLQLTSKGIVLQSVNKIRWQVMEHGDARIKSIYASWQLKKDQLIKSYQRTAVENGPEIAALINEVNLLEKQLSEQSSDFASWSTQKKSNWKDVQQGLKENEAAIELIYVKREISHDSIYVALVLRKGATRPEIVSISPAGILEGKQLKIYRNSIQAQLEDTESYKYYWKPIAGSLPNISRAFVSADGIYHQINLSTLYNKETKRYVADEINIQVVPSTALIAMFPKEKQKLSHGVVVIAHPDYGDGSKKKGVKTPALNRSMDLENLADLPGTELERLALGKIFQKNMISYQEFVSREATEGSIKAIDNPTVLHIATHGFFLNDGAKSESASFLGFSEQTLKANPLLRSGLLLAGCQDQQWKNNALSETGDEDQVLTAFEASALKLETTQLVVLSACETGLGEIKNGEGVYGLQRAFVMAGAQQVMMSLWKVDDQATQEFMTSFYTAWLAGGDTASAFNKAQADVRANYPAPYYWGAFVLTGF